MNELQRVFDYGGRQVRTVMVDGEPHFVAKDVCEVFGDTNYRRSVGRLDEDEKGVSQMDTPGGLQEMTVVNEAGLYALLFQMQPQKGNLPDDQIQQRVDALKKFKRWITHEVLPAIRQHGGYLTPEKVREVLSDPDTIILLAQNLKKANERANTLVLLNAQKEQIINELRPKATYYDLILQNKSLLSITKIAKDYGMSGVTMNAKLHELGVQFKQGDIWLLYQKHADKGYTQSKTHAIDEERNAFHTYWTQKGRLFIYDLLKNHDILPLIEREPSATAMGR